MVTPRKIAKLALLFAMAAVLLGYGIQRAELGAVIGDPVGGIRAQDETTYANSALHLATHGGWLTPKVMGRLYLIKPPLLIWLSGLSLRTLGVSRLALRLPVLLAAVLATLLVFLWAEKHSRGAAVLAGLLAVGNPLWHTYARVCYTDMLLALAIIASLYALRRDPDVAERRTMILFASCTAVGVMAKNIAGLIPVMILLVSLLIGRRRIPWGALLKMQLIAVALILPWHLYQLITNSRWFMTDYVYFQLFRSGVTPPAQSSEEGQAMFYLRRLWLMDPLLCLGVLLAAPSLLWGIRQRKAEAALLASWLLVTGAALLAFSYRNLPYLLYAIPALCVMAATCGPLATGRKQRAAVAVLAIAFGVKVMQGSEPWGLWIDAPPLPGGAALREYTKLARPGELLVVDPNDEYYSSDLPLPRVRYGFVDPSGAVEKYVPHYSYLGITISAATYAEIEHWRPQFRARLREWGLDSEEPIGTVIVARSESEVLALIARHPRSDFYLPGRLLQTVEASAAGSHRVVDSPPDRFFLLARDVPNHARVLPRWWKDGEQW